MSTRSAPPAAATAPSAAGKLPIQPGTSLWVSDEAVLLSIGALPDDVATVATPAQASTAVLVARDAAALRELLGKHRDTLEHPSVLWVAYPKRDRIDLTRDTTWPILVEHGCRPVGQASISDDWSAMRFRPLAPGEAAFTGGR